MSCCAEHYIYIRHVYSKKCFNKEIPEPKKRITVPNSLSLFLLSAVYWSIIASY